MRKFIMAAAIGGTLCSGPALAQAAVPASGPRIEIVAGYDAPRAMGDSESGVVYGVGTGYDFLVGGVSAGLEAEFTESTAKACAADVIDLGDRLCARFGRDLYVGGRVGGIVGNALVYIKGGYTNSRISADYDDGGSGIDNFDDGTNLDGFRVGAGAEVGLGTRTFVKGEYRYSNYESGFEKHQGVVGLGLRF